MRTASDPYDADASFGAYLQKVANASRPKLRHASHHGPGRRRLGPLGVFGGDPVVLATAGRAWMAMLTLQLGVLIDPHFA